MSYVDFLSLTMVANMAIVLSYYYILIVLFSLLLSQYFITSLSKRIRICDRNKRIQKYENARIQVRVWEYFVFILLCCNFTLNILQSYSHISHTSLSCQQDNQIRNYTYFILSYFCVCYINTEKMRKQKYKYSHIW